MQFEDVFSVQIFFIILRETVESAIIISVLLSFLNQNFKKRNGITNRLELSIPESQFRFLKAQIWLGGILGLVICLFIGGGFVAIFYLVGNDLWSLTERLWEGVFSILSSIIISIMGMALLRINQMQDKWHMKLNRSLKNQKQRSMADLGAARKSFLAKFGSNFKDLTEKYFLGILPFITTLREGLEAVVFIGGIGVNQPLSSFPLAIVCGAALGTSVGLFLYRGGNKMSLQYFLVCSTCFLYLVSAGLMSRGVWFLELEQYVKRCDGQDMSEVGSGPGSYDVANTIWHVNCCNGLTDGGWMLFNALLGWQNSATYGSIVSYNGYWILVILALRWKLYQERNGYVPMVPIKWQLKAIRKRVALYESRRSQIHATYDELASNKSNDSIELETNQDTGGEVRATTEFDMDREETELLASSSGR